MSYEALYEKLLINEIENLGALLDKYKNQLSEMRAPNLYRNLIDITKTFDNLITGQANILAVAASKEIAKFPGRDGKYQSLYIHGLHGLGKTHLLHAIANEIKISNPSLNICIISARSFMDEMITLMKKNRIDEFIRNYTERVDVLMIDDIHELRNKEGTQDQFFHLFNEMRDAGKQLVFTSDKRPREIKGISERIKSRLQWCLLVDLDSPNLNMCIDILRNFSSKQSLPLTEEILNLIVESTEHNPRDLESALLRLKSASELLNVKVTSEMVKEQLK